MYVTGFQPNLNSKARRIQIHSGAIHPGSGIYRARWQSGCSVFRYKPNLNSASWESLVIDAAILNTCLPPFGFFSQAHGILHILVFDWQFQNFVNEMCGL